jgi:predicted O-methyltransferase YrrM
MTNQMHFLNCCPELFRMYAEGAVVGASGQRFDLGSCSTLNNLAVLKNLVGALKPRSSMEVGLAFGASCLLLASTYKETGAAPRGQHVAIDPFQEKYWDEAGLLAIRRAELEGFVEVREELSCLALPKMLTQGRHYDLIYVDGSHLFEDVFVDAYYCFRLVAEKGIVLFDDSRNAHVKKVVRFVRRNLRESFEEIDLSPYRLDRGRGFKYRLARMLDQAQITGFRRMGPGARPWNGSFTDF